MWPWRSLVPTIEIVTGGAAPRRAGAACVGGPRRRCNQRNAAGKSRSYMMPACVVSVRSGDGCHDGWLRVRGRVGQTPARRTGGRASPLPRPTSRSVNRNVDILFLIDDSSSMGLAQNNLLRDFPTFMTPLQDPPWAAQRPHGVISSDMGAGDGSIAGCDSTGGKQGIFQYTARGDVHDHEPECRRDVHLEHRRRQRTTRARSRTCSIASRRWVRPGAASSTSSRRILRALGADGRAAPAENQGFLRPDAYLAIIMLTNEDDCSATPGRAAVRHGVQHEPRVAARPAGQLSLQRVRAHLRRRPPPPPRSEQRRDRHRHLQRLHVERHRGLPAERRGHREPTQGPQGRSAAGCSSYRIQGPASPYVVQLEEPGRRRFARAAPPRARGRRFRIRARPPTGASPGSGPGAPTSSSLSSARTGLFAARSAPTASGRRCSGSARRSGQPGHARARIADS